jgi:uncharacterized protein (DUF2235 family)
MAPDLLEPASAETGLDRRRSDATDDFNSLKAAGPASLKAASDYRRQTRKLILCFDGTGNKFHGDDSDSNILKIFRMLDRTAGDQYHYYQRACPMES